MTEQRTIPGTMTASAYAQLAGQHRPSDQDALQREIRRLHTEQGLTPRDISQALCVALCDVLEALREVSQ